MGKKTFTVISKCAVKGWSDAKQREFNFDFHSRNAALTWARRDAGLKPGQFTVLAHAWGAPAIKCGARVVCVRANKGGGARVIKVGTIGRYVCLEEGLDDEYHMILWTGMQAETGHKASEFNLC